MGPLRIWNRHTVFGVLASTCVRLRALFYDRSWGTTLVTVDRLPALISPPKDVWCNPPVHLIQYVPLSIRTTIPATQKANYDIPPVGHWSSR